MNSDTLEKDFPVFYELGKKLEKLGVSMQSGDTVLSDLVALALDCGLSLQFRVVAQSGEVANSENRPSSNPEEGELSG